MTGGTRGIGNAIALAFLKKGYRVAVTYSADEKSAEKSRAQGLEVYKTDVADEKGVTALFQSFGGIDILVNNAGVALVKQIQDTTFAEYQRVMSVNMGGAFLCSREGVKSMLARGGGLIVNISSVWGEVGGSCESAYSASKAALIGFTKALAKELAYSSVRVNCVSPGVIDTSMNARFSDGEIEELCAEIPVGRMGAAEEVAAAVLFLEENEYITGVDLPVNGGFSLG